jgi:nicotinamide-nucleotide amidase
MQADIITIGDEILIGQVIDTNSGFIGKELSKIGIPIRRIVSISDKKEVIQRTIDTSLKYSDFAIITGGLGPTNDDVTKLALADYFGAKLVRNQNVLDNIQKLLQYRGAAFTDKNSAQADVPENCIVLNNKNGTAPGMLFQIEDKVVLSLPGVPFEMKSLITDEFIPWIQKNYKLPYLEYKTLLTTGVPESLMADRLSGFEEQLPENMSLAYLPSPGILRLRLSVFGAKDHKDKFKQEFEAQIHQLEKLLGNDLFGYDDNKLEQIIGKLLIEQGKSLSIAESCTGGNIAHMITGVPGSSSYFKGSIVAYSNNIKNKFLDVSEEDLLNYGAVSKQVVIQMAEGAKKMFGTDYAIATSGIAGPGGGTKQKPVGTVWFAVSSPRTTLAIKYNFGENRERTIIRSSIAVLNLLRLEINKIIKKTVEKV